jgi:hypothetical protein
MSIDCINQFLSKSKATQICVAFFILCFSISIQAAPRIDNFGLKDFEALKKNVANLLIQKKRAEAIQIITAAQSQIMTPELKSALFSVQENALSFFLSQTTQDFYENAASQMIQKTRFSEKNVQQCLEIEPDNLYCRWQQLRLFKFKNDPQYIISAEAFIKDTENLPLFSQFALGLTPNTLPKNEAQLNLQKNQPHLFLILEFERSIKVKNYSLSKELLQQMKSLEPDYPDLTLMSAQLITLSQEESPTVQNYRILIDNYKKTCSNLRAELTRKYFYDIHLCHRSL